MKADMKNILFLFTHFKAKLVCWSNNYLQIRQKHINTFLCISKKLLCSSTKGKQITETES